MKKYINMKNFDAIDIATNNRIPLSVPNVEDFSDFLQEHTSCTAYMENTGDYSSELLQTQYIPVIFLLDYDIEVKSPTNILTKPNDSLSDDIPNIERLYYMEPTKEEKYDFNELRNKLGLMDDIASGIVPIVEEVLSLSTEYKCIPSAFRSKIAHSITHYLIFIVHCNIRVFGNLYEGRSNLRCRIDGRMRIYYPEYKGKKDWQEIDSNGNGAYEISRIWDCWFDADIKDIRKAFANSGKCTGYCNKIFEELLDMLSVNGETRLNEVFCGIMFFYYTREYNCFKNIILEQEGASVEIKRNPKTSNSDPEMIFDKQTLARHKSGDTDFVSKTIHALESSGDPSCLLGFFDL